MCSAVSRAILQDILQFSARIIATYVGTAVDFLEELVGFALGTTVVIMES